MDLVIDRRAGVGRHELDETSWVELISGFVCEPEQAFAELRADTAWAQSEVLRYDHYVPERRLSAGLDAEPSPLLRQTELHVRSRYRVPLAGVGALLYRDGGDFQGLHSDREMRWLDDTVIAIAVLGQRRPFVFRRRTPWRDTMQQRVPAGDAEGDIVLLPGEGDVLVMGGACQRDWMHGVPAANTDQARISLTWRWTSRRGRPDTNPKYSDGRQYSDRPARPGTIRRRP